MKNRPINYTITVNDTVLNIKEDLSTELDLIPNGNKAFHLLHENRAYSIKVVNMNFLEKKLTLSINGNQYEVGIADTHDQMVKEMGLLENTAQKVNEIYAPMPGLIIDIMVEEGQEIKEGTPLMVLSAMKMENIILSQGDGIVKSVNIKKGDAVEKGQLIIEME
ncbi:MAG: acetyl-CoA carboxylase biotin carboxyl carrier protein subunit [Saonia sp.]